VSAYEVFDPDSVDEWAVDLVVKEGVLMNLNYSEKLVAAGRMSRKKMSWSKMRARLRVSEEELMSLTKRATRMREKQKQDA
jgi:hypothetical protein